MRPVQCIQRTELHNCSADLHIWNYAVDAVLEDIPTALKSYPLICAVQGINFHFAVFIGLQSPVKPRGSKQMLHSNK